MAELAGNEFLARIARMSGLEICVKPSQRQGTSKLASRTLKLVTAAIVGAVWLDSDRNFNTICDVVENLGSVSALHLAAEQAGADRAGSSNECPNRCYDDIEQEWSHWKKFLDQSSTSSQFFKTLLSIILPSEQSFPSRIASKWGERNPARSQT